MASSPPAWQHLPALDGLRAAAVIAVLLFHADHLRGGFLGVDLFFALSGFLITSLLLRDARGNGVDLRAFWGRRFRRLLPAVLVMIVAVTLWSWWFGTAVDLYHARRDGPWAVLYLANWHTIAVSEGYWASFAEPSMFDHLWSLAIEEQFYLLWPVVVLAVWTWTARPQRTLMVVIVLGAVASFAAMLWLYDGGDPTRVYMGTDTRAASLLVGALAATAPAVKAAGAAVHRLGASVDAVLLLLLAALIASWATIDGATSSTLFRGGLLAHSVTCAVLVAVVAQAGTSHMTRLLSWRPLIRIGTLSYGLYLWHWPVYVAISPTRTDLDDPWLTIVRLAVSWALAVVSLRLVEDPVRHRARWVRGRSGGPILVGSLALALAVVVMVPAPVTQVATFDPSMVDAAVPVVSPTTPATADPVPTTSPSVTAPPTSVPDRPGTTTAPATTTTSSPPITTAPPPTLPVEQVELAIWSGDSVAYDQSPAVAASLGAAGVRIDVREATPALRLVTPDRNLSLLIRIPERVDATAADLVVMQVSLWDSETDDESYRAALEALIGELRQRGVPLALVPAPPTGDSELNALLTRRHAVALRFADDHSDVAFLDSGPVWGEPGERDLDGDGVPERKRDLIHVCPAGAARFAAWLSLELTRHVPGLEPRPAAEWATGEWVTDQRYDEPVGACEAL